MESILLRELPLSVADAPAAGDHWARSPLSTLADSALIEAVASAITPPKRDAESSFLTHAPLELAARAALLPMVAPDARDKVRRRIAAIAAQYAREGDEIDETVRDFGDAGAAIAALRSAMREGDIAVADAALVYLSPRVSPLGLRRMIAADVIPMLSAAAHVPIFLAEMLRLDARLAGVNSMLRAPMRKLTRFSQFRLTWHERVAAGFAIANDGEALFEALSAPPAVYSPSNYIAPTMQAVEADGYAEGILGEATAGLSVEAARRTLLRIGALSMLQDDPAHAPYGWSHALTMPQGVIECADGVEDKAMAVRIAATHVLGFRATIGKGTIRNEPPPRPKSDEITNVAPIEAAGAVYHASENRIRAIKTSLASRAAAHRDAHLAKYTLACFDAAVRDQGAGRLFLAAAAYLGAWWDQNPDASFE